MALFGLSQAISRAYQTLIGKFPIIRRDALTPNGYYALGGASTGSFTPVGLYVGTLNNTRGGGLYLDYMMTVNHDSPGTTCFFFVQLDGGGLVNFSSRSQFAAGYYACCGGRVFVGKPAAGNHVITVYWDVNGGTASIVYGGMSTEEVAGD